MAQKPEQVIHTRLNPIVAELYKTRLTTAPTPPDELAINTALVKAYLTGRRQAEQDITEQITIKPSDALIIMSVKPLADELAEHDAWAKDHPTN